MIWKFPIPIPAVQKEIQYGMPHGAEVLSVQMHRGQPTMWVQVNPSAPEAIRRFIWYPSGIHVPPGLKHMGTLQMQGGEVVLHLFEIQR